MPSIAQVEPVTTARALRGPFDYRLPDELRGGSVQIGSMLVVPFGRRQVLGVVVGLADSSAVASEKLLAPLRALELGVPAEMVGLAGWIAAEYCSTLARALALVLPPGATRRLSGRKRRASARTEHRPVGARMPAPPPLGGEQAQALAPLREALAERAAHARLLHGVTGSGKTEVYLRAAEIALAQGRGAIVLVPEIALTPQIVGRFIDRFGDTVAVLHSQLRPGERYAEWRRLREGEARICVGPRSAVFAPIERLGLIVVDEEHDASYKHEGDPRYDARDVAGERARRSGAVLLLGSATPRAESAHRLPRSTLTRRVDGRPLPRVEVLDMRGDRPKNGQHGLHPRTVEALAHLRGEGGKAIVLLNRRGWSNFMSCRACGRVWGCPHCDVALVLHRAGSFLACHHCGHREPAPQLCPACSSSSVARHGAGTERVAHELAAVLDADGAFPVFRLDADSVSASLGARRAPGAASTGTATAPAPAPELAVAALLRRFQAAESGVLIGTQMVAKGHDFPDVELGVVLDADATLRFPDFRAEERTFALIAQLAGRVGRGREGRVLVQTIAPDARAIAHAARHDSDGFLAGEIDRRRALSYPPFSHMVRIVCSAREASRAQAAAAAVRARLTAGPRGLDAALGEGVSLLGPAALFRLRERERAVLVVKALERRPAVRAVGEAVERIAGQREHRGVSFSVDVDPQ
jgi:primosomal protein N' (replication factor Y) (superfamily II helicase)